MYIYIVVTKCLAPLNGNNTKPVPESINTNGLPYSETYVYSCIDGFATTDDVYTTCLLNGSLSLTHPPSCKG